MNRTFMLGYYQGVVETAPAVFSAAKTAEFATAMTVQHLRHANVSTSDIHDFLINDAHVSPRIVAQYISLSAAELEAAQAKMIQLAFRV